MGRYVKIANFQRQHYPIKMRQKLKLKKAVQPVKSVGSDLPIFTLYFGVKDNFDRFIFTNKGASDNEVTARFSVNATDMYEARSAMYAADVFTRYIEYKVALANTDAEIDKVLTVSNESTVTDITYAGISLSDVEQKLATRDTLRLSYFSQEEYEYLFSADAAIDARALARLAIAQDRELSREQKRNEIFGQLNALDEQEKVAFQPTLDMEKKLTKLSKGMQIQSLVTRLLPLSLVIK